jgi:hypothetical protein
MTLSPWYYWSSEKRSELTRKEALYLVKCFPFTKGFGGHTTRCYLNYETALNDNLHYITFLREPVARYLSHFNYQKNVKKVNWTLEEFIEEKRFENFMTVRIAGISDIATAKKHIDEKFSFVGLIEYFDESLVLMRNELKLKDFRMAYEKQNKGTVGMYSGRNGVIDASIMEKIRQKNDLDLILYEYVRDKVYPNYKERFTGNLKNEVSMVRQMSREFCFALWRRLFWGGYRWLIYRNIEHLLKTIYRPNAKK